MRFRQPRRLDSRAWLPVRGGSQTWRRSRSNRASPPRTRTATDEAVETDVAERKEQLDEDIDAILEEIDDVLETNAEDFVKSFIQKGGE